MLNVLVRSPASRRYFYDWRTKSQTIFAAATAIHPTKGSPLGILRVSGPKAGTILEKITQRQVARSDSVSDNLKNSILPRHATLSKIFDSSELIDIGLVLWFPKPKSYTGEDSCELHVHGSAAILKRLLTLLGEQDDTRPAEAGEFTRRAVANGKISLIQAESLPDLMAAQTDQQRKLALKGLVGNAQEKYEKWINDLVKILAHLEASIDFGEDELIGEQKVVEECVRDLTNICSAIDRFITITRSSRNLVKSGVQICILGRPNAGKSTFMNLLCQQSKSIVSDLSGTTRDVIEHLFDFGGHSVTLCDTAGLRYNSDTLTCDSDNPSIAQHEMIELEGIRRALDSASRSSLIIYLVDGWQLMGKDYINYISEEFVTVTQKLDMTGKFIHLVINKIDLAESKAETINTKLLSDLVKSVTGCESVCVSCISCKTQANFNQLTKNIKQSLDELQPKLDETQNQLEIHYANERHLSLLISSLRHLSRASELDITTIDEMAQHVRESVDYLSRIVGTVTNDQVIDVIFRDFCIGK